MFQKNENGRDMNCSDQFEMLVDHYLNLEIYLSKSQYVFVQIAKCIIYPYKLQGPVWHVSRPLHELEQQHDGAHQLLSHAKVAK